MWLLELAFIIKLIMEKWTWVFRPVFAIVSFIVNLIIMTVVFYIAGIVVVGKQRALLSDAFVISLFGTLVGALFVLFIPWHLLGLLLSLIIWLLLIKHYYETGWLGALAVAILAVIIYVAVLFVLALLLALPFLLF